jgi:hypothetical protein
MLVRKGFKKKASLFFSFKVNLFSLDLYESHASKVIKNEKLPSTPAKINLQEGNWLWFSDLRVNTLTAAARSPEEYLSTSLFHEGK